MPSDAVLRRKAQKKRNHRKYGKCERCGGFTDRELSLFGLREPKPGVVYKKCRECKHIDELVWTGVPG